MATNIGSDQYKAPATSTVLTVDTAVSIGDVVLVRFVADNTAILNGESSTHTGVTDTRGNTWVKVREHNRGTSAGIGLTGSAWKSKLTTALQVSDTITVSHEETEARNIAAEKFTGASGVVVSSSGGAGGDSPDQTISGLVGTAEYEIWALLGVEHDVAEPATNDPDYSAGTYIATSGGAAASNIQQLASVRTSVTGVTSDTYGVELAANKDHVIILVAVELTPVASGGAPTVNPQDVTSGNALTEITADWFEPTDAGEYLLAIAGLDADGAGSPVVTPASTDWTLLASDLNVGNCLCQAYGIPDAASRTGSESFFISDPVEPGQDAIVALFRLGVVEDFDSVVSDQGADSSAGMDAGSIVTSEPNQLLVYVAAHEGDSGLISSPANGFDEQVVATTVLGGAGAGPEDHMMLYVATKVEATAGTYPGANYDTTEVEEWSALLLSFFSSGAASERAIDSSAPAVASLARTINPARDLPTSAPAVATLERSSDSLRDIAISAPAVASLERSSTALPIPGTWTSDRFWRGAQTWRGLLESPSESERDIASSAPANAVLTRSGASYVREINETAGASASLASIVPGTDPGVSFGLVHTFTSPDGSDTRELPVTDPLTSLVDSFTCTEKAPGGYDSANGVITHAEKAANPTVFQDGATWKVERDGTVIWAGTLTDPDESGPAVLLKGLGSAVEAEQNFERALWLTLDMSGWTISDSDPFEYDTDTKKIEAEVKGRELRFKVPRNTNFTYRSEGVVGGIIQPGNDGSGIEQNHVGQDTLYWSTGLVNWFPTVDVRGVSFDCEVNHASEFYKVQVLAAPSLNDPLEVMGTFGLANDNLTNRRRTVDCAIPDGYELVMVRLKRGQPTPQYAEGVAGPGGSKTLHLKRKSKRFTLRCKNVAVRALASEEDYKTHEVVLDLAERVAPTWDISGVQTSTTNVGPLDTQGSSAAAILDDLGFLDDFRWLAHDEAWEWGPWDTRVYNLLEDKFPRDLIPTDRFNAVEVPFRYRGGYISSKTVIADSYVSGPLHVYRLELDRPPPEDIATIFAQVIANYLWQIRFAGTAEFTWVEPADLPGIQFDGWQVHAGDTLVIDSIPLRIESMSKGDTSVVANFTQGHPLLDKLLARRTRELALGKSNADATLGGLGLDIPKTPTGVEGAFDEVEVKGGSRRFDAILDWEEVTEDIVDQATVVNSYIVEWRYVLPDGTRRDRDSVRVKAQGDDDDPNDPVPTRVRIRDLAHPHKWKVELHVCSVDAIGREGAFSSWTPAAKPAAFGPRAPQSVTLELNRKKLELEYDLIEPAEADSDGEPSLDRTFNHVRIKRFRKIGAGPWEQVGKTIRTRATGKTWAVRKPRGKSFKCELWTVDDYGNTSSVVTTNATRKAAPNAPTVRSRRRHPRRIEWRLDPPTSRTDGTTDDFEESEVEAYDYTVLHNGVVDEDRSDHFRKALTYSIEIPKNSTGWKLRRKSIGVDGNDSAATDENTTVDDETVTVDFPDIGGTITLPQFPSNMSPIEFVTSLPTTNLFDGRVVSHRNDANKLYRYFSVAKTLGGLTYGPGWVKAVDGSDMVVSSVTADKMNVSELSAITADLGTVNAGIINGLFINGGRIAGTLITTSLSGTGARVDLGGTEPDRIRIFGNVQRGYLHADAANLILQLLNASTFVVKGQMRAESQISSDAALMGRNGVIVGNGSSAAPADTFSARIYREGNQIKAKSTGGEVAVLGTMV